MRALLTVMLFTLLTHAAGAQAPAARAEDFVRLTGARWAGELVYLDYGSDRKVSIRSRLTVTRAPGDGPSWVFEYEYPDEPKANGRKVVGLGEGGRTFDGETVVERRALDGGAVRIVTERRGKDDGRDALFRYTYLIGASAFSLKKEVRPEGAPEFFERSTYSWTR